MWQFCWCTVPSSLERGLLRVYVNGRSIQGVKTYVGPLQWIFHRRNDRWATPTCSVWASGTVAGNSMLTWRTIPCPRLLCATYSPLPPLSHVYILTSGRRGLPIPRPRTRWLCKFYFEPSNIIRLKLYSDVAEISEHFGSWLSPCITPRWENSILPSWAE